MKELLGRYSLLQETTWSSRLDKAVADLQQQRRARIAGAQASWELESDA